MFKRIFKKMAGNAKLEKAVARGFESVEQAESIASNSYKKHRSFSDTLNKLIDNQKNLEENAENNSGLGGKMDYTSMRGLFGDYDQRLGSNGDDALGVMDIWRKRTRRM